MDNQVNDDIEATYVGNDTADGFEVIVTLKSGEKIDETLAVAVAVAHLLSLLSPEFSEQLTQEGIRTIDEGSLDA